MAIKIVCDKCKIESVGDPTLREIRIREFSMERKIWIGAHKIYICENCTEEIFKTNKK